MIEFDDNFYDTVIENMKSRAFLGILSGFGLPDETLKLLSCLIRAGCPVDAIMKGLMDYSEYLKSHEGGTDHD